jgi:hypothetical protein
MIVPSKMLLFMNATISTFGDDVCKINSHDKLEFILKC